jgi:hypothetical protein
MHKHWSVKELAEQEKENARSFEEQTKRCSAATGTICGNVVVKDPKGVEFGLLSFLSIKGYSPVPFAHPTVDTRAGGAFCSSELAPGKYDLYFMRYSGDELVSSVYYPGVGDRTQAKTIEISAGTNQSGIIFDVPAQKTYSVRGFISTNDSSGLTSGNVSVTLTKTDGLPFPSPYVEAIDFQSLFPLPKVKCFHFDNVLPGRYIALASVRARAGSRGR